MATAAARAGQPSTSGSARAPEPRRPVLAARAPRGGRSGSLATRAALGETVPIDRSGRAPVSATSPGGGSGTQFLKSLAGSLPAEPTAPVELQRALLSRQPIVSFAGGGIFFFWEIGVLKYLSEQYDLSSSLLVGASAGGLVATLAACGVDADRASRAAYRISLENGVFERPGGLAGIWGNLIRAWLEELLPPNAAELCRGRVKLIVTEVPSLRLRYLEDFKSKQDLIDANMASVHIPFFLDGNATCSYRGGQYIDGSLWDFIWADNSALMKCDGEACVVDYFFDDQLKRSRLDFIKLAQWEEVVGFVRSGYAYAERTDAAGGFSPYLGGVRKGALRQVLEYPGRRFSKAFSIV